MFIFNIPFIDGHGAKSSDMPNTSNHATRILILLVYTFPFMHFNKSHFCVLTFAHILAALTIAYVASAFFATVMSNLGNIPFNLAWYFSGGPTVSTYTYKCVIIQSVSYVKVVAKRKVNTNFTCYL